MNSGIDKQALLEAVIRIKEFIHPQVELSLTRKSRQWDDYLNSLDHKGSYGCLMINLIVMIGEIHPSDYQHEWCSELGARKLLALSRSLEQRGLPALSIEDKELIDKGLLANRYLSYLEELDINIDEQIAVWHAPSGYLSKFWRGLRKSYFGGSYASYTREELLYHIKRFLSEESSEDTDPYQWDDFIHSPVKAGTYAYLILNLIYLLRVDYAEEATWLNSTGLHKLKLLSEAIENNHLPEPSATEKFMLESNFIPKRFILYIKQLGEDESIPQDELKAEAHTPLARRGRLNKGRYLQIGWVWRGSRAIGKNQFRIAFRFSTKQEFLLLYF